MNRIFARYILFALFPLYVYSQPKLVIRQVDTSNFPILKAYVGAIDAKGESILGLDKANFILKEDGNNVVDFSCSPVFSKREWISIVLAIDKSGSMKGNAVQEAKRGAKLFLQKIGLRDKIALIVYDKVVSWKTEFTSDKNLLEKEIDSIYARGNTAFYDTIIQGLDKIIKVQSTRKALVLLTDGKDTESKSSFVDCLEKIKKAQIPIYLIGLGKNLDRKIIDSIAQGSKGDSFFAASSQDLQSIYSSIAAQLKNQYILQYHYKGKDKNATHLLEIRAIAGNISIADRAYYSF